MEPSRRDDIAPLFEAFGAAVFNAQLLEHSLRLLLKIIDHEREKEGLPRREVDLDAPKSPKTIGILFGEVKSLEYLTDAERKIVAKAVRERNFLIHSYWGETRTKAMLTIKGREWLVQDLTRIREICRSADRLTSEFIDRYLAKYGQSIDALSEPLWQQFESSEEPPSEVLH